MAFRISVLPWKQLWGLAMWAGSRVKAFKALSGSLLILLLPAGVPVQEKAPAKLIVYLQRFRPQDYQHLLEVLSPSKKPQGTKAPDSSLG